MSRAFKEQTWAQWVREVVRAKKEDPGHPSKLFNGCMAPITGTDHRVLDAFVPCMKLYAYSGSNQLLAAATLLLKNMQPSTRWIARELIPFVLDWGDRERLWPLIDPAEVDRRAAVGRSYGTELVEEFDA
jgi:hypothetical protein